MDIHVSLKAIFHMLTIHMLLQVQFLEDDKFGLLVFHAENLDGVLELDNGQLHCAAVFGMAPCASFVCKCCYSTVTQNAIHLDLYSLLTLCTAN